MVYGNLWLGFYELVIFEEPLSFGCQLVPSSFLSFFLSFFFGSPLWPYPFGNIEGMGDQEVDLSETAVV